MSEFRHKTLWSLVVLAFIAGVLATCGQKTDDERADEAVAWLLGYRPSDAAARTWRLASVRRGRKHAVIMDVVIPEAAQVGRMRRMSRMQQSAILQLVCPSRAAFYDILAEGQKLWINLNGKAGNIISGSCKNPHQ
ncbi:MAG TPA: hypothetical protein QGF63_04415 [Alphaproteobacteria bacterium]|jgi:hypothetical protein|nr:hypothetical protein [Alphaproteobacteria bacterium]MDP7165049.1 hypothetical protein [Alphaproteobacteria bacterium]HJM49076.1 hypothetical protein [Alphaproteobacteria bacterium]